MYTAKNVRLELEVAKHEFLQASVGIHGSSKVNGVRRRGELVLYSFFLPSNFCSSSNLIPGICTSIVQKALVPIQLQGPPRFSIMPIGKLG